MGSMPMVTRKSFTYRSKKGYDLPTFCFYRSVLIVCGGGI